MICIFFSLLIAVAASSSNDWPCSQCTGPTTGGDVWSYCQNNFMHMHDHCCVNSTTGNFTQADIVGIDLRDCNLNNVTGLFRNMTSLVVISLEGNPLSAVTEQNFYHLTKLDNLTLPDTSTDDCPGGKKAWKVSKVQNGSLLCMTQINTCLTNFNNETCPLPQSYCSPAGPGLVDCLCSQDYHGYKCLRKGTFPTVPFVAGICSSTLVTAIFLWVTQRRFVKKPSP